LRYIKK